VEVVASLSQDRTAAAQCGLFTHKSVPVIFEPPCEKTSRPLKFTTDSNNSMGKSVSVGRGSAFQRARSMKSM